MNAVSDAPQVRVLLFGALRDRLGCAEIVVRAPVRTVADLWDRVTASRPEVATMRSAILCARNLDYCDWKTPVADGDEVAFMPPVSGGAADDMPGIAVTLTDQPIDLALLLDQAGTDADGAVACFVGRVRNHSAGESVHLLEYEAYGPMALSEMKRIAARALESHGLTTVTLVHRIGALAVGEVAVAVVTASVHRASALEGCREVIDAIKAHTPIWKREHTAAGAQWLDARC
jgi:molybdopterin synthase catalytic subunit/molybdopterin converting factor small subunit